MVGGVNDLKEREMKGEEGKGEEGKGEEGKGEEGRRTKESKEAKGRYQIDYRGIVE